MTSRLQTSVPQRTPISQVSVISNLVGDWCGLCKVVLEKIAGLVIAQLYYMLI